MQMLQNIIIIKHLNNKGHFTNKAPEDLMDNLAIKTTKIIIK
ncbi:Uncharacterised protein [Mycobacteroides abscessus]|nr:Uncharacterised protein [Mycobacteroides abscessus]